MVDDFARVAKCEGKDRFADRSTALTVIRERRRRQRRGKGKNRIGFSEYRCEYCNGWHISGHRT